MYFGYILPPRVNVASSGAGVVVRNLKCDSYGGSGAGVDVRNRSCDSYGGRGAGNAERLPKVAGVARRERK